MSLRLAVIAAFLCFPVHGELSKYKDKFNLGWEIELTPPQLEKVVSYFDFAAAWKDYRATGSGFLADIPERLYDDYLESAKARESLPREWRREVEAILAVKSTIVLDAETEEALVNDRLRRWWTAKPLKDRLAVMDPEHFSKPLKAALFVLRPKLVTLKADAPSGVQDLFSALEWVKDQDTVEFRFKQPLRDAERTEALRDRLGRLAQISRGFVDTKEVTKNGGASYHIHISTADARDLTSFLHVLNLLQAARLSEGGRDEVWKRQYLGYSAELGYRGVIRQVAPNRVEIRVHAKEPAEELEEVLELLSLDEGEAKKRMMAEIRRLLTPERVKLIENAGRPDIVLQVAVVLHDGGDREKLPLTGEKVGKILDTLASPRADTYLINIAKYLPEGPAKTLLLDRYALKILEPRPPSHFNPGRGDRSDLAFLISLSNVTDALNHLAAAGWPEAWRKEDPLKMLESLFKEPYLDRESPARLAAALMKGRPELADRIWTLVQSLEDPYRSSVSREILRVLAGDASCHALYQRIRPQ